MVLFNNRSVIVRASGGQSLLVTNRNPFEFVNTRIKVPDPRLPFFVFSFPGENSNLYYTES